MGLSNYTCPECRRRTKTPLVTTVTGRRVCARCRDGVLAAAAGVIASPETPIAGAVSTRGWFQRLRRRRDR